MAGHSQWLHLCPGCSRDGGRRRPLAGSTVLWRGKGEMYHSPHPMERSHPPATGILHIVNQGRRNGGMGLPSQLLGRLSPPSLLHCTYIGIYSDK